MAIETLGGITWGGGRRNIFHKDGVVDESEQLFLDKGNGKQNNHVAREKRKRRTLQSINEQRIEKGDAVFVFKNGPGGSRQSIYGVFDGFGFFGLEPDEEKKESILVTDKNGCPHKIRLGTIRTILKRG